MAELRRKYKRENILILITAAPLDNIEHSKRAAMVDISLGGCALEIDEEFARGTRLVIRIIFPNKNVEVITGEVIRVSPKTGGVFLHGVKFDECGFFRKIKRKNLIRKLS